MYGRSAKAFDSEEGPHVLYNEAVSVCCCIESWQSRVFGVPGPEPVAGVWNALLRFIKRWCIFDLVSICHFFHCISIVNMTAKWTFSPRSLGTGNKYSWSVTHVSPSAAELYFRGAETMAWRSVVLCYSSFTPPTPACNMLFELAPAYEGDFTLLDQVSVTDLNEAERAKIEGIVCTGGYARTDHKLGKEIMDLLPNLKVISTPSTGINHIAGSYRSWCSCRPKSWAFSRWRCRWICFWIAIGVCEVDCAGY